MWVAAVLGQEWESSETETSSDIGSKKVPELFLSPGELDFMVSVLLSYLHDLWYVPLFSLNETWDPRKHRELLFTF